MAEKMKFPKPINIKPQYHAKVSDAVISDEQTRNPYQEFYLSFDSNKRKIIIDFPFNCIAFLYFDGNPNSDLKIQLGDNPNEFDFSAFALGLEFEHTYKRIALISKNGTQFNLRIALANGKINDNRLNYSNAVGISGTVDATIIPFNNFSGYGVKTGSAGAQLLVSSQSTGEFIIQAGTEDLYIGDGGVTTGTGSFLIPVGKSEKFKVLGDIYGIREAPLANITAYIFQTYN